MACLGAVMTRRPALEGSGEQQSRILATKSQVRSACEKETQQAN